MTATPAPVRAQGTCTACGRDVDLLPSGDRVSAHGVKVRRTVTRAERVAGFDPRRVYRGRCPGTHQPPTTETTEV